MEPIGVGLFDLELNLADPSEIDHLVLQEGEEEWAFEPERPRPECLGENGHAHSGNNPFFS